LSGLPQLLLLLNENRFDENDTDYAHGRGPRLVHTSRFFRLCIIEGEEEVGVEEITRSFPSLPTTVLAMEAAARDRPPSSFDNLLRSVYFDIDCFTIPANSRSLFYHIDQTRQLYVLSEDWSSWERCVLDTDQSDLCLGMASAPFDMHNG